MKNKILKIVIKSCFLCGYTKEDLLNEMKKQCPLFVFECYKEMVFKKQSSEFIAYRQKYGYGP